MKPRKLTKKNCGNCRFWSQIFSGPKGALCLRSERYTRRWEYCAEWKSGHHGPQEEFNRRAALYAEEEAA